jgi:PBSX family phage terminase large subunit
MDKIKIHEKYRPLWTTDCYLTIVTGGRGSGKSYAVSDFIENLSFEIGHKILYSRYTLVSASVSIMPEFQEKISVEKHDQHFYTTQTEIKNTYSGSEIIFKGIKSGSGTQTAQLKSIEGLTTWVLEEAEELDDEREFNKIKQSIRKKGIRNRIILVLNPKSNEHWIYKRYFEQAGVLPGFNGEKDGVCYIHTTYLDNLDNLSEEFLTDAEKCKLNNPNYYAYEYMGEWVLSVEGAYIPAHRLQRYSGEINSEGVNLAYVDCADSGGDHFAAPIGRLIGNHFFVTDAIFNLENLNVNEAVVKERIQRHKIDKIFIESNSFGAYFKRNLREQNPNTPIDAVKNTTNKHGRILAQSGYIIEFFVFPQEPNEELSKFIRQVCSLNIDSKTGDDAPDSLAGLAACIRRNYLNQ